MCQFDKIAEREWVVKPDSLITLYIAQLSCFKLCKTVHTHNRCGEGEDFVVCMKKTSAAVYDVACTGLTLID